jgi:excisionase family DNA binding protein
VSVPRKRTYTIAEAAELTGLSRKAIARRVERESLRSVVHRGRRLIPRSELVRAGLVPAESDTRDRSVPASGFPSPLNAPLSESMSGFADPALNALLRDLLERLERQAGEIAHFRAITAQAESLRREDEISELRARLLALENERRRPEVDAATRPAAVGPSSVRRDARSRASEDRIWLPPSAERVQPSGGRAAGESAGATVAPARGARSRYAGRRLVTFGAEAVFIVGVAAATWLLELPPVGIVAVVGIAWILVALLEWLRFTSP